MEEERQSLRDGSERRGSSWKVEDLLDVESGSLAADLASTNLGRGQVGSPGALTWGIPSSDDPVDLDFNTYDMSTVLDNLEDLLMLQSPTQMNTPSKITDCMNRGSVVSMTDLSSSEGCGSRDVMAVLKAPTAHGIRNDQDRVTYLNRGQSYEVQLQSTSSSSSLYKNTLTLSFCELRWQNSEKEHFDQWCRDHPCDRLLEIDSKGSTGLQSIETEDTAVNCVSFSWGCGQKSAVVAIKLNCLSTEFAVKKHGGEKGVPLRLLLEMHECKDSSILGGRITVFRGMCVVKVFKDKGGDRKQRQDQVKVEKLTAAERLKYHPSESVSRFQPLPLDCADCHTPSTPSSTSFQSNSDIKTTPQTPGNSPYSQTTPIHSSVCSEASAASPSAAVGVAGHLSVEETHQWLMENRFGQYCSLFANYTSLDLMRLSRRDLMQLCGHADGIRLFNSLRTTTLKTIYVLLPGEKVYQAVYLDKLTGTCLLQQLVLKIGWLSMDMVSSFVQFVPNLNLLVKVEDTLVQAMQHEDVFNVQTVKQEDGYYQVVIQYQFLGNSEPAASQLSLSLEGATQRRNNLQS